MEAKFCTKCGKELGEGGVCECVESKEVGQQPIARTEAKASANVDIMKYITDMYTLAINFFKSPSTVLKEVIQKENYIIGLTYLGIVSVLAGLFSILSINRVSLFFSSGFSNMGLGDMMGDFGFSGFKIKIPYFRIFFTTTITVIFLYALLVCAIYVVSRLMKATGNYKSLIGAVGVTSIPLIIALVVSSILMFISVNLTVLILIAAFLFGLLAQPLCIRETFKLSENRSMYNLTISYIIVILVSYIIKFI